MQRLTSRRNPIVAADDRGVAAVEYGLIEARAAGTNLGTIFTTVADRI